MTIAEINAAFDAAWKDLEAARDLPVKTLYPDFHNKKVAMAAACDRLREVSQMHPDEWIHKERPESSPRPAGEIKSCWPAGFFEEIEAELAARGAK